MKTRFFLLFMFAGFLAKLAAQPTASFNIVPGPVCAGSPIQIADQSTGAVNYFYNFGSGLTPTVASPQITYSAAGIYTITLIVDDGTIASGPFTQTVEVNALPPVAITGNTAVCAGSGASLTASGADTYTWSTTSNLSLLVVFPTGLTTYTVTGTNTLTGCVNTQTFSVDVNPLPTVSVNSGTVCANSPFTLVPSGAVTYTYSGGSAVVSPAASTSYTVSGEDANGCISSAVSDVTVFAQPVISVNSGSICAGDAFTLVPSGAVTYTFSSGSNVVSPAATTSYSVSGTDAIGCVSGAPAVADVTVNALPVITAASGSICAGQSFSIVAGGASTYTISGGSFNVSPASTSSYSVTGTSPEGCVSAAPAVATVTVNTVPVISVNSGSICNGQSFVMVPTGASTYTFSSGTATVNPTSDTSYSVTGTSLQGCLASNTAVSSITVNSVPVISVNSGSICAGQSFVISPSGAATYTISGGTATVSPASNSSYSVTGTSAAGCLSSNTAVSDVTVNALPVISVNSGSICNGQSFAIVPSGASSYTVTGGSFTVSPSASSSYSVTGTSAAGCVSSNTAVSAVTVVALPVISVSGGTICNGGSFVLSPSGASTYTYSSGSATVAPSVTTSYSVTGSGPEGCVSALPGVATVTVSALPVVSVNSGSVCNGQNFVITPSGASTYTISGGTFTVSPATTTSYSVTGISAAGCVSSNTAVSTVTVNSIPVITVNSGSICAGGVFTIVPSGASTYSYSSGSSTVSPAVTSSYSVTGTSAAGCAGNTAVSSVTVVALPVISVNSGAICSGGVFTITPSGANTYTISGGSATVSPSSTTSYSVTGTSLAGCVSAVAAVSSVTVNALPVVAVNSGSICAGQVFTMVPTGASTYTFSSGSATVNPATTTSYSVTGTSAAGCLSSNTAVSAVTVSALPVIAVNSGSICAGQSFTLVPSGASTYTVTGGSNVVTPAVNTSYSVTGTSLAGCVSSVPAVANVTVVARPVISVNNGTTCAGQSFTIVPSGASTYTITGGSFTVNPTVSTSYSVTGTASTGCTSSVAAVSGITVSALPVVAVNSGSVCAGSSFTIVPSGASTYTISGGSATVNPATTTSYSVTGTSSVGCVSSNTAVSTITVQALPVITVNSGSVCAGQSFTLVPSGAATYTYSGGSAVVTPVSNTSYSVTGTSSAGCISSAPAVATVTVMSLPTVIVSGTSAVCSGAQTTLAAAGASTYSWINVGSGQTVSVTPAATTVYSVIGTASTGCTGLTTFTVNVNPNPTITVNSGVVCPGGTFTLQPSGAAVYLFQGGSNTVSPLSTTVYTVSGISAQGCTATAPASATVSVVNSVTLTVTGPTVTCSGSPVTLSVTGAGTYSWSNGATGATVAVSPTTSASYSVLGVSGSCSNVAVASVSVNPLPVITVNSGTICEGATFVLTPAGAATYSFSGASATVTPSATTIYSVTGTSTDGCVSSAAAEATVVVNPTPTITVNSGAVCQGGSYTLAPSGAATYTISGGSTVVTPSTTSSYTIVGTDVNGCLSGAAVADVTVNALPNVAVLPANDTICAGESATLVASGATSYTWNGTVTGASFSVAPAASGSYSVTGTDANGCSRTAAANLVVNECTGIAVNSLAVARIYPNPSNGAFTIETAAEGEITITSMLGSRVAQQHVSSGANVVSISQCDNGVYFVTVNIGGQQTRYRVVKQ